MSTLVDFRCPKCNGIVYGNKKMDVRKNIHRKPRRCPTCKTVVALELDTEQPGTVYIFKRVK